jgi:SAM-dependent methyltransferase
MPRADPQRSIEEARKNFDAVLHTPEFKRVHADDAQLNLLIDLLAVAPGGRYLDLGTGNGYAAFGIAGRHPCSRVTGVDIAGKAIERNIALARDKGLTNVDFAATDGIRLGVPVNAFDGVICRYALHHLPALRATLRDVFEALKGSGRLVIADPIMVDGDAGDFMNRFLALNPDGHVRIYTKRGLLRLLRECGFQPLGLAMTEISFTRPLSPDCRALMDETPPPIRQAYGIARQGNEVSARLSILNAALARARQGRE